jgi:hypothetical protein
MKQKKRGGKVIRFFKVEISDVSSAPELYANPNNPYAQLSEEERIKDFNEIFGLLWAESCRETSRDVFGNKKDCNK